MTTTPPLHLSIPNAHPGHTAHFTDYRAAEIGSVALLDEGDVVAGSYASFTLVFTAGRFGMDDTGSIRICTRQVSDVARPQFTNPKAANYVSAEASNGALLSLAFDPKLAMRPWSRTITVTVVRGFLSPGDTLTVRLGDRRGGSPGLRMQTYCEDPFRFLVLADVFAACNWALLPGQPAVKVVPGPPVTHRAILPTLRRTGDVFSLLLRADDAWGNPSAGLSGMVRLRSSAPVAGLPDSFDWPAGARAHRIEGLTTAATEALRIDWLDAAGQVLVTSNPLRVAPTELLPFWADLHGQSGESVGSGNIVQLASYARDLAGVDAICHQANDFQVTAAAWAHFNEVFADFDEPGRFVFLPGYEWSGNTALGGDRNVIFPDEGRTIRRSCHALVEDLSDAATDALDARELHSALRAEGLPVLCVPHVGGRYANLFFAHDRALERAVEVHSDWGTFDWLLEDAFAVGARVGIVANSDGHKGRQGASHPGGSQFGSYGGLTCLLAQKLDRAGIFDALMRRHHFATTNGTRVFVDTRVALATEAAAHIDDPALGGAATGRTRNAMMGDILADVVDAEAVFSLDIQSASPIERVILMNRTEALEVWRPACPPGARRIRVMWEGSEYRGRGRETFWDGSVSLTGNGWSGVRAINRWNIDHQFAATPDRLDFHGVTTGGAQGFEAILDDAATGTLEIATNLVTASIPVADIGAEDVVFEAGGLGRRLRVFRLPDVNPNTALRLTRTVALRPDADNALFLRAVFEDGCVAWSSPIYLIPR
ncbi:DUF3604 domain-containing protein [Humitalea sp. 24SJ18S-53]|uniref:DUF3604 domain-containing protein n=1 Tax=Humitalea sp. 24SJ18S-53 TaxID=3422307 RepID=UPI003D677D76